MVDPGGVFSGLILLGLSTVFDTPKAPSLAHFLQLAFRMVQSFLLFPQCEGEFLEEAVSAKAVL